MWIAAMDAMEKGNIKSADVFVTRLLSDNSEDALVYTLAGILAYRRGREIQAVKFFNEALKFDKNNFSALFILGIIYEQKGNYIEAYNCFKKASLLYPEHTLLKEFLDKESDRVSKIYINKAKKALKGLLYERALNFVDRAIETGRRSYEAYSLKGDILLAMRDAKKAKKAYYKAIKFSAADCHAYLQLSKILLEENSIAEAKEILKRAILICPADKEVRKLYTLYSEGQSKLFVSQLEDILSNPFLTRGELAALIISAYPFVEFTFSGNVKIIVDISGHWAEEYIKKAVNLGLMDVYPNHNFLPDRYVTRQSFAKLLCKILKLFNNSDEMESNNIAIPIEDIPKEHLLYSCIKTVVAMRLMKLKKGKFEPFDYISGKEAYCAVQKVFQIIGKGRTIMDERR